MSVSLLYSRLRSGRDSCRHYHVPSAKEFVSDPMLQGADTDTDVVRSSKRSYDWIDELDDIDPRVTDEEEILGETEEEEGGGDQSQLSGYSFNHLNGVIRRRFDKRSIDQWEDYKSFNSNNAGMEDQSKVVIGSDDVAVYKDVGRKVVKVRWIEDALLLKIGAKASPLREGWGPWFDAMSDFLRRDRMFKSYLEILNPLNNPLLQDPDGVGVTGLTRGDKLVQKVPFLVKKPLGIEDSDLGLKSKPKSEVVEDGGEVKAKDVERVIKGRSEVKRAERRTLDDNASNLSHIRRIGDGSVHMVVYHQGVIRVRESNRNP